MFIKIINSLILSISLITSLFSILWTITAVIQQSDRNVKSIKLGVIVSSILWGIFYLLNKNL